LTIAISSGQIKLVRLTVGERIQFKDMKELCRESQGSSAIQTIQEMQPVITLPNGAIVLSKPNGVLQMFNVTKNELNKNPGCGCGPG